MSLDLSRLALKKRKKELGCMPGCAISKEVQRLALKMCVVIVVYIYHIAVVANTYPLERPVSTGAKNASGKSDAIVVIVVVILEERSQDIETAVITQESNKEEVNKWTWS